MQGTYASVELANEILNDLAGSFAALSIKEEQKKNPNMELIKSIDELLPELGHMVAILPTQEEDLQNIIKFYAPVLRAVNALII